MGDAPLVIHVGRRATRSRAGRAVLGNLSRHIPSVVKRGELAGMLLSKMVRNVDDRGRNPESE